MSRQAEPDILRQTFGEDEPLVGLPLDEAVSV